MSQPSKAALRLRKLARKRAAAPPVVNLDELISRAEAARLLGLKPDSLSARRSVGLAVPPCYRIGRGTMYLKSDIAAFIAKHRVEPPGESA